MTDNNHPITPPPELLQQWAIKYWGNPGEIIGESEKFIATQAARWGADMELEACCEWMASETPEPYINALRAARRPKPPSLKELALEQLKSLEVAFLVSHGGNAKTESIRRALEQLDD